MRSALSLAIVALTGCAALPAPERPVELAPEDKPARPHEPRIQLKVVPPIGSRARCPAEMALVDGRVCVDRFEGALEQVLDDGTTRAWSPHHSPVDAAVRAIAVEGVTPQAHISGVQAERACRAAGKRLCSADEWERACRGPRGHTYPYGPSRRSKVCNDDGRASHPVGEITRRFGLDPERMWYEGMSHPGLNQLPDTLEPTGAHGECRNDYGTHDMVGNLHEWIDDPAGTFRGGFFMDTQINGEGCEYATTAHGRDYRDYSTGFRCCRDPEPLD
jgi:formylglycine-generating enzyme